MRKRNYKSGPIRVGTQLWLQANGTFRQFVPKEPRSSTNISGVFSTAADAKAWREACRKARKKGEQNPPASDYGSVKDAEDERITVAELAEACIRRYEGNNRGRLRPATVTKYASDVRLYVVRGPLANRDARSITCEDDVWDARDALLADASKSDATVSRALGAYCAVFEFGQTEGLVPANPFHGVKGPKGTTFALDDLSTPRERWDLTRTRQLADALSLSARLALWIERLCGLRPGEALGLWVLTIDFERSVMLIFRQGGRGERQPDGSYVYHIDRTKTPAGIRFVGIPKSLLAAIRRFVIEVHGFDPVTETDRPDAPLLTKVPGSTYYYTAFAGEIIKARNVLGLTEEALGYKVSNRFWRPQLNTDLTECPDLTHEQRLRILGHEMDVPTGSSRVNQKHYIIPAVDLSAELRAAEFMEAKIVAAFGEGDGFVFDAPSPNRPVFAAYTVAEAAIALNRTPAAVRGLIERGVFETHEPQYCYGRPQIFLKVADVEEFAERDRGFLTPRMVTERFGIPMCEVRRWCRQGTVEYEQSPSGRLRINEASILDRVAKWEERRARPKGISLGRAAHLLDVTPEQAQALVDLGELEMTCRRTGDRGVFVSQTSVDALVASGRFPRRNPADA